MNERKKKGGSLGLRFGGGGGKDGTCMYGRDLESLDETVNFKVIVIINIKLNVKPF